MFNGIEEVVQPVMGPEIWSVISRHDIHTELQLVENFYAYLNPYKINFPRKNLLIVLDDASEFFTKVIDEITDDNLRT